MTKLDINKAFHSFFGCSLEKRNVVIITNINPIYEGILSSSDTLVNEYRGFYKIAEIIYQSRSLYVAKINPGNCIVDCIRLLKNTCRKIIFMGIAASLNPNINVGDICVPKFFGYEHKVKNMERSEITIAQTDGMIQDIDLYNELYRSGVDIVDMECCDFVTECRKYNLDFDYLVHISDEPLFGSFFYDTKPVPVDVEKMLKRVFWYE